MLDIILLLAFFWMVTIGAVKGFVKSVLGMVALIAAFVIAYQLSAVLAPIIYDRFISERIYEAINTKLSEASGSATAAKQVSAVLASIPEYMINIAASIGIDTNSITEKINGLDNQSATIARELADSVAAPVVTAVTKAIVFVVLLSISYILLMVVVKLIDKFFKLPLLKTANRLLGGALGAVKGAILVYLLCVVILIIVGTGKDTFLADSVDTSKIMNFLNENNFIVENFKK
jgi:uncharacterized membrane protein required for colicin V production